jgi:hypothetical protein
MDARAMRRTDGNVMIGLLAGLLLAAGCGSGTAGPGAGGAGGHANGAAGSGAGGNGGEACQPLIPGDGTATWTANGVAECATVAVAAHDIATLADTLEIDGSTTTGLGLAIVVSVYSGTLGGTYMCGGSGAPAPYVNIVYGGASTIDTCSVTIDSAGTAATHATGSFSATASNDGGIITIANGHFDTPVTTTGG